MTRNKNRRTAVFTKLSAVTSLAVCAVLSDAALLWANGAEGEAGAANSLNPLQWKADLAIWTGVVFLMLLAVLWKFAFGPIAKALDAREQAMLDKVNNAEKGASESISAKAGRFRT